MPNREDDATRAEETLRALFEISQKLNATLDLDKLLDNLVLEAIELCEAESGCAGLRRPEGMVCERYFRSSEFVPFRYCWPPGHGIPGWLLVHRVSYLTNEATGDEQIVPELKERFGVESALGTPILDVQEKVIGFLEIHNKKGERGFNASDRENLVAVAQIASSAIQNALAHERIRESEKSRRTLSEELRALAVRLQAAREEESARLAREIHDELSGALTALKMDLSLVASRIPGDPSGLVQRKMEAMAGLIDATLERVRNIVTELRPGILDDLGLVAALEWQAEEFQRRSEIRCLLSLPKEEVAAGRDRSTVVFRILQEALTNVARHANASSVSISLREQAGSLILEVRDNGAGINLEEISSKESFGLLGMRERALAFGGEVQISGSPGVGTTVILRMPLERE